MSFFTDPMIEIVFAGETGSIGSSPDPDPFLRSFKNTCSLFVPVRKCQLQIMYSSTYILNSCFLFALLQSQCNLETVCRKESPQV